MARTPVSSPWPTQSLQTSTGSLRFEAVSPRAALLVLDEMESSYIDLDDPAHLEFEYMQQMDIAADAMFGETTPVRALHLGGAGCALARAWAATRPGSKQIVVEWDAILAQLAREFCDVPRSPAVRIRVAEARSALEGFPEDRWDIIVRDTFANAEVPDHMRTRPVAVAAARSLAPEGVYLANLTDRPPLAMARSEAATLASVFDHVSLIADPAILRGRRYGNLLLVASHAPHDDILIARRCRGLPMPVSVLSGDAVRTFARTAPILRDPE